MSKKKRKKKRAASQNKSRSARSQTTMRTRTVANSDDAPLELLPGQETRAAESATVVWVLCTLATAASLMGTVTFAIINAALGAPADNGRMMQMLPQWFMAVGVLTGIIGLIGNTLTQRWRNHKAPSIVRFVSAIVCAIAVGIGVGLWL
ncbi:MAG: hypothetical protein HOA14_07190 [Planctomycetaceae bacterium]|nr:hypothetical protein [Planctomycetaceae bacterium]MBT5126274.1 hypothetical protein [Planctomycetaceae bacterium]MBT5599236.1 hypothetical protein [Planctomycetaceae bacterium]MBT6847187.1 hypothetical protein [Planctomycetaceae bacterium]